MIRKQMENDIKRQRDISVKDLREHVASLKYRPHLTDYKDE